LILDFIQKFEGVEVAKMDDLGETEILLDAEVAGDVFVD
jgi:hypothetical protein